MKKTLKWGGRTLLVGCLVLGLYVGANWYHVKHFPSIISSFYAKMMCSCLFVHKQDEISCHNFARQYVPIQKATVSVKDKSVTVKGLWRTNTASFVNQRAGCKLQTYHP